jgi:hypothetical protein
MTKLGEENEGMENLRLSVNQGQVEGAGERLVELDWRSTGFATFEAALPTREPARLADYFFFNSALLFDFYNMETELDGEYVKGSDLFFILARQKAEQDPDFFSAAHLTSLTVPDYAALYAPDGDATHTLINRAEERVTILHDLAQGLLRDYEGSTLTLLAACKGRLHTPEGTGLLDRLSRFEGYDDPHFKKAFVLLKFLDTLDLWHTVDIENLFIPVDYHLIRMALRTGIVTVTDAELAEQLRRRSPATEADDWEIREVVKRAYKALEASSGVNVFILDEIFWTIGRSCCHYSRPPRCANCDYTDCSVMKSFDYDCPGRCPLATTCLGARDESYRGLFEPRLVTTYY